MIFAALFCNFWLLLWQMVFLCFPFPLPARVLSFCPLYSFSFWKQQPIYLCSKKESRRAAQQRHSSGTRIITMSFWEARKCCKAQYRGGNSGFGRVCHVLYKTWTELPRSRPSAPQVYQVSQHAFFLVGILFFLFYWAGFLCLECTLADDWT